MIEYSVGFIVCTIILAVPEFRRAQRARRLIVRAMPMLEELAEIYEQDKGFVHATEERQLIQDISEEMPNARQD